MHRFIVFEGIDGSGKDTQAAILAKRLDAAIFNAPCYFCDLGKILRKLLNAKTVFGHTLQSLGSSDSQKLFTAEKIQHYFNCIAPVLQERDVVQVRWTRSAPAYGFPVSVADIEKIQSSILGNICKEPTVTFYLDVTIETAWTRITERNPLVQSFYETQEKLRTISERYKESLTYANPVIVIDGNGSVSDVAERIIQAL